MSLPNWNKVCERIVDGRGAMHTRCVQELEGLDLGAVAPEPKHFFQTDAGLYTLIGAAGLALWWFGFGKPKQASAQTQAQP